MSHFLPLRSRRSCTLLQMHTRVSKRKTLHGLYLEVRRSLLAPQGLRRTTYYPDVPLPSLDIRKYSAWQVWLKMCNKCWRYFPILIKPSYQILLRTPNNSFVCDWNVSPPWWKHSHIIVGRRDHAWRGAAWHWHCEHSTQLRNFVTNMFPKKLTRSEKCDDVHNTNIAQRQFIKSWIWETWLFIVPI